MQLSKCIFLSIMFSGCLVSGRLYAQTNAFYAIEANIVYHFTKYIDWPNKEEPGDFVIGVIGSSPVYDEMVKLMDQKTAGGKKITLRRFKANSGGFSCQILFITEEARSSLKEVVAATAGSPVLIVCEGSGLARRGAEIDLAMSDEHLKLEINKGNIERHKLQIASELLQLGTIVN
jgi:uncharacterized protein DUF4154